MVSPLQMSCSPQDSICQLSAFCLTLFLVLILPISLVMHSRRLSYAFGFIYGPLIVLCLLYHSDYFLEIYHYFY